MSPALHILNCWVFHETDRNRILLLKMILSMLLEDKSVNPDSPNRHKQTPLMLAAMHGKINCVEKVIEAGANGCLLQVPIVKLQQYTGKIIWNSCMSYMVKKVGLHMLNSPKIGTIYIQGEERTMTKHQRKTLRVHKVKHPEIISICSSNYYFKVQFWLWAISKDGGHGFKASPGKTAKLGDQNKFYYDEKLKRWVEEGVDPLAEEAALAPPPTMAAFQNVSPDYSLKTALRTEYVSCESSEFTIPTPPSHGSGIPPIPATSNQFSARGRMGVQAVWKTLDCATSE